MHATCRRNKSCHTVPVNKGTGVILQIGEGIHSYGPGKLAAIETKFAFNCSLQFTFDIKMY